MGEFLERSTLERAIKTKTDTRTKSKKKKYKKKKKEWASSVGLCQGHKPQHPHHVKANSWGPFTKALSDDTVL